ncbi:hypothetical protein, partial [Croceicoccus mobilis]|uniref:hypothetical protein n=1 Tax=Croceicoccus mobilis TaxID=1703339 RepID=UPI001E4631A8
MTLIVSRYPSAVLPFLDKPQQIVPFFLAKCRNYYRRVSAWLRRDLLFLEALVGFGYRIGSDGGLGRIFRGNHG